MKPAEGIMRSIPRVVKVLALAVVVAFALSFAMPGDVQAAAYKSANPTTEQVKIDGATYKLKTTSRCDAQGRYTSVSKITMTTNGTTKTLAKNAARYFVTNGTYLYYAKRGASAATSELEEMWDFRTHTIYRLTIATGVKKKIVTGTNIVPFGARGKFLYYGKYRSAASDDTTFYMRNLSTKKSTFISWDSYVGIAGKRVITKPFSNASGTPLYSYKANGTNKMTIAENVTSAQTSGKRVIYSVYDESAGSMIKMQCSPTGANKKVVGA